MKFRSVTNPIVSRWVRRMTSNRLEAWLRTAVKTLTGIADNPLLEAQVLAGHVLQKPRTWLIAHPEKVLLPDEESQLNGYLARRVAGEPLPYLLGYWEFFGLDFMVTPDVLIPRPETELLVENALNWLKRNPNSRVVDVGTGSGCIAISIALNAPHAEILAVDISRPVLRIASNNIKRHQVDQRISLVQADLLTSFTGPFDLVCANLPYIPQAKLIELEVTKHEPRLALDGGVDGLVLVNRLLSDAPRWMATGGVMLLEIESGQGQSALDAAHHWLPMANLHILPDLAGLPRLLVVEMGS